MKYLTYFLIFVLIACNSNNSGNSSSSPNGGSNTNETAKELQSKKYVIPSVEVVEHRLFKLDKINNSQLGIQPEFYLAWNEEMLSISDENMWLWEDVISIQEYEDSIKLTTMSNAEITLYQIGKIKVEFNYNNNKVFMLGTEIKK